MAEEAHSKKPLNPNAPPYFPIKPWQTNPTRLGRVTWRSRERKYCDYERERKDRVINRSRNYKRSENYNSSGNCNRLKKHEVLPLDLDNTTTVLIKNVPKHYTRGRLLNFLDEHCAVMNSQDPTEDGNPPSAFDFVYLPIDFQTGNSKGFAFVNFSSTGSVKRFYQACNNQSWELDDSNKVREIVAAINQGKKALLKYSSRSKFFCHSDEFLPISFSPPRDGSNKVVRETTHGTRVPCVWY